MTETSKEKSVIDSSDPQIIKLPEVGQASLLMDGMNHAITFNCPPDVEMIKLDEGKFYFKGQEVDDPQQVYERFAEWINLVISEK